MIDDAGIHARLTDVAWSTRVRLQHRVADRYRAGGVFLAGDAAHASSPAGGQGMNTGIHDALNLGWKLALAGSSSDPEDLLDSYEAERRAAAHQVLALTHCCSGWRPPPAGCRPCSGVRWRPGRPG